MRDAVGTDATVTASRMWSPWLSMQLPARLVMG